MTTLNQIKDRPFAIDLRIDLSQAALLRADAAAYSLWPDAPFGASADAGVWPSVFVHAPQSVPDRIAMTQTEAPFWHAFQLWDDIREMVTHVRPLPIDTITIALARVEDPARPVDASNALGQLLEGTLTAETRAMQAVLLGYDITDVYLQSALFDAGGRDMDASAVPRSDYGLIATRDAAKELLPRLEADDPAHAPLQVISVWSLGHRPATVPATVPAT